MPLWQHYASSPYGKNSSNAAMTSVSPSGGARLPWLARLPNPVASAAQACASVVKKPATFTRYGLIALLALCAIAYFELLRWNDTSQQLIRSSSDLAEVDVLDAVGSNKKKAPSRTPKAPQKAAASAKSGSATSSTQTGASDNNAGTASDSNSASSAVSAEGSPPPTPNKKQPLQLSKAPKLPSPSPFAWPSPEPVEMKVSAQGYLATLPEATTRVCINKDVCMRASEWDRFQRIVDCWGRPGSWIKSPGQAHLHGRKWAVDNGISSSNLAADLPPSLAYSWTPSGESNGMCSLDGHAYVPFYRGDFCRLLGGQKVLIVGDMMQNELRTTIADAAAPGLPVPYRPGGEFEELAASDGADAVPVVAGSLLTPVKPEKSGRRGGRGGRGRRKPAKQQQQPKPEEEEETTVEEEESATDSSADSSTANSGEADAEELARKRAEALILSTDKDSIGTDGMTDDASAGTTAAAAEEEEEEEEEAGEDPASKDEASGEDNEGSGGSGSRARSLLHAANEGDTLHSDSADADSDASDDVSASGSSSSNSAEMRARPRQLRREFTGGESEICDGRFRALVEYRRNDRLYLDGDNVPRNRAQGFYEYPWMDGISGAGLVVIARPVPTEPDERHFGNLRRALRVIRTANPKATIVVRSVVPPHIDCAGKSDPLWQRQPSGWLRKEHQAIYSQNEALRMFLRLEFPGVIHMDVTSSTSLRIDGHNGDCLGYQQPGPVDNWVRMLYNILELVKKAKGQRLKPPAAAAVAGAG